ncbi:unnamed protein product [Hermetia illucens]|uniref:PDZ domain-containing protein n=3 Tax=Hermetia illucens TaxID=343691 RepID=A0A7R8YNY7_HERIL|nr:unnamed protein product [Hermetia illucens]
MHPAMAGGTSAGIAATIKSGEVGSRNEFLSASMLGSTVGIEEEQWQQYADAVKRNESDRHSRSKENRRDWRRSYNRNTINCYNIQEGKIIDNVKIRDRSLSPSFLRRKKSDVMDVRKIFETKRTKEPKESNSQDFNVNTVRIRCRNNLVKERRNPLPTTRLSFCEPKLAYDEISNYSNCTDSTQAYNVDRLNPRINDVLNISTTSRDNYNTNQFYHNENCRTKVSNNNFLGNKSKSVEDFSKEDIFTLNRLNKPENKFKTLSGKTQKFLSNFYRTRFEKNSSTPKQQSPPNQHNHRSYEMDNKFATDLPISEDIMNNEWCLPSHYRLSDSCYSTLVDSHLMTTTTDADSGILENDSGQSSLNSIPVTESVSSSTLATTDTGVGFNDALTTINHNSNGEARMLTNADFLVTVLCDESFNDLARHLYHSKGSYFMTNIIVKKIKLIDGFILAGDEILDICGIPIRGKSYIEVYNLLQNIQLNTQNNYVRMLLRRISEIGGNGSATVANAYQKGVVNSRRNGICSLRDLEKSSEKSLDYAAKAIRIDGSRTKLKPPTDTPTLQKKSAECASIKGSSMHFQKNVSAYGSISRKLIRRSVLGKVVSNSVVDVSEVEALSTAGDSNKNSTTNNSGNESDSTETGQQGSVSSNFFTLPRKSKIGVYGFHTIRYEKGPGKKSLGFTIVGGRDSPKGAIGIFVKRILNTGQAIEDGRLRVGDEILSVNGQVCHDLSHEEAVKLFKSIRNGEIVLRVCRREKQSSAAVSSGGNENKLES